MSLQQTIIALAELGRSKRRSAGELQLDRATGTRQLAANAATNPAVGLAPGPPRLCAPFAAEIVAAVEAVLPEERDSIWICAPAASAGGYPTVKLFVRRLVATVELRADVWSNCRIVWTCAVPATVGQQITSI